MDMHEMLRARSGEVAVGNMTNQSPNLPQAPRSQDVNRDNDQKRGTVIICECSPIATCHWRR